MFVKFVVSESKIFKIKRRRYDKISGLSSSVKSVTLGFTEQIGDRLNH
jgi:hypothetical protein